MCIEQKVFFPYMALPGAHNNASKINSDLKIRGLAPFYSTAKIRFRKDCEHTEKLLDQLWRFPKAPHDDYPDALSMHLHLPLIATRIWQTKETIIIPDTSLSRYGQEVPKNDSKEIYI